MAYDNKLYIDWAQITADSITLAKKIKQDIPDLKGIVCITRGGLAVTAIVSQLLGVKHIDILCLVSYSERDKMDLKILQEPESAKKNLGEGWIIIDELVDSGQSVRYGKSILPKAKIYSLYSKLNNIVELDYFVKFYDANIWLEFPWEITL